MYCKMYVIRTAMDLVSRYRILYRVVPDDEFEVASQYKQSNSALFCADLFQLIKSFKHTGSNVCAYIPFYILYFILMALHAQFAQSALGIGRRYRRLNNALQLAFPIGKFTCCSSLLSMRVYVV